ncbi:uncharacterized protein N7518_006991 [Penicillium psychrosexuale]|uniref:uncharacterized protein n=1 Tax=Penicillium psychrosexuale TaxID=1002107 RepID=UPI0025459F51|nr:uncharacterized protein N7518_006991 [Penicillium psychrosexuale]KAJ5789980.1 hypothetical protein N7518_006991 [Penicillium psychrosexuale]
MLGFTVSTTQAGAIRESIRQSTQLPKGLQRSIYIPVTRLEPLRQKAPSQASTLSTITRSKGLFRQSAEVSKGQHICPRGPRSSNARYTVIVSTGGIGQQIPAVSFIPYQREQTYVNKQAESRRQAKGHRQGKYHLHSEGDYHTYTRPPGQEQAYPQQSGQPHNIGPIIGQTSRRREEPANSPRSTPTHQLSINNTPFTIIQYNTYRSRDIVIADFLAKTEVSKADIIVTHELLFPSSTETGGRARTHYAHSEFYQEVRLQAGLSKICFFNIYNECGTTGTNGEQTTIDLFFGTPDLTKRLVVYELALECHTDSDHLPIHILIDIDTPIKPAEAQRRRLWKAIDTKKFDVFMANNLPIPPPLTTPRQIDNAVDHLIDITKEYREAIKHSRPRNQKGKVIKAALRHGFRNFIKEAGQQQGSTIPVLKTAEGGVTETDEDKVNLLRKVFFPQPPEADLSDIRHNHASYREQYQLPPVSDTEVRATIKKAPPNKAPGYDTLPNKLWRVLTEPGSQSEKRFISLLTEIFNAYVQSGYNPQHFQTSVTVTLQKAVTLLNILGKVLEAIVITQITWLVEEHNLLPDIYLGGRKGVSVDHTIQLILRRVHQA